MRGGMSESKMNNAIRNDNGEPIELIIVRIAHSLVARSVRVGHSIPRMAAAAAAA